MSQTSDGPLLPPIVAYMDPKEGVPIPASNFTDPHSFLYGKPIPEGYVGYTQEDLDGIEWDVTI